MTKILKIVSIVAMLCINNICYGMERDSDEENLAGMNLLIEFIASLEEAGSGHISSDGIISGSVKTLSAKPSLLSEELNFAGDMDEHISLLRSAFYKVIRILQPSTNGFTDILSDSIISLEQLREDFSKVPSKLEKLIFCKEVNSLFHHNVCDNIDKILQNPVGRSIITRILKSIRDKKILFIPIEGFHGRDLKFEDPALMVITGEKYDIITVPIDTKIRCFIPGINKKDFSLTMMLTLPFHSSLAHELIHCMHDIENRELYQKLLLLSPSTCRVLEEKMKLPENFCDFPTDEELYTLLGVHMTPNEGINRLLENGRKITSAIEKVTLKIDEISELTYDIFDADIPILRILYYNERTGCNLSCFAEVGSFARKVLQLFDASTQEIMQQQLAKWK